MSGNEGNPKLPAAKQARRSNTSNKLPSAVKNSSASSKPGWRKAGEGVTMPNRTYAQSMKYIERIEGCSFRIKKGFVPNMKVDGRFYVNERLEGLMLGELQHFCTAKGVGGFLPAVTQIANVASLPGIIRASMAMPDVHSGYGFAIGNVGHILFIGFT